MDPKRKGKLKGMDPMYDGKADIKQNEKAKKKRNRQLLIELIALNEEKKLKVDRFSKSNSCQGNHLMYSAFASLTSKYKYL